MNTYECNVALLGQGKSTTMHLKIPAEIVSSKGALHDWIYRAAIGKLYLYHRGINTEVRNFEGFSLGVIPESYVSHRPNSEKQIEKIRKYLTVRIDSVTLPDGSVQRGDGLTPGSDMVFAIDSDTLKPVDRYDPFDYEREQVLTAAMAATRDMMARAAKRDLARKERKNAEARKPRFPGPKDVATADSVTFGFDINKARDVSVLGNDVAESGEELSL